MILDQVSVVCEFTKKLHEDGNSYHEARFLKEHVYYGSGAASDAHRAMEAANELDSMHKSVERHHKAVRMDFKDAVKEGLL